MILKKELVDLLFSEEPIDNSFFDALGCNQDEVVEMLPFAMMIAKEKIANEISDLACTHKLRLVIKRELKPKVKIVTSNFKRILILCFARELEMDSDRTGIPVKDLLGRFEKKQKKLRSKASLPRHMAIISTFIIGMQVFILGIPYTSIGILLIICLLCNGYVFYNSNKRLEVVEGKLEMIKGVKEELNI